VQSRATPCARDRTSTQPAVRCEAGDAGQPNASMWVRWHTEITGHRSWGWGGLPNGNVHDVIGQGRHGILFQLRDF
jgi:hypothetical protein